MQILWLTQSAKALESLQTMEGCDFLMSYTEYTIEGRNAVLEAFRSGRTIDKLFILDGCQDGPIITIKREARKQDTLVKYVEAIIRTANLAGAHGVIIPKNRAVGLTATVARTSAGALNYTPVAKVTNMAKTIESLKKEGMWFVCADMGGTCMYDLDLKGPIGLVIGNEGEGVSRLVRDKCDFVASIPMKGDIDSLNASVAAGVMAFEIVHQRGFAS